MLPKSSLASSTYCLANEGKEYLIYLADINNVTVDLTAVEGDAQVEWLNPSTGKTMDGPKVMGGNNQIFESPFKEDGVVLFIQRSD
jgi:hypothetical protein